MTHTRQITDGTTTISLVNSTGFRGTTRSDGVKLSGSDLQNDTWIPETHKLLLHGTNASYSGSAGTGSEQNLAEQLIALIRLLRKAERYFTDPSQPYPVYMTEKVSGEANTRYALVRGAYELMHPNLFERAISEQHIIPDITLTIIRESAWRSGVPGTLPTASTIRARSQDLAQDVLGNSNEIMASLEYIYNYDDSASSFSVNYAGAAFWPFKVSTSVWEVDDCVYFGSTNSFMRHILLPVLVAGVYTADEPIIVEYGKGGGSPTWTALTLGTEYTIYPTEGGATGTPLFGNLGLNAVNVNVPSDGALATVNGQSAYWIRLRIPSGISLTTMPSVSSAAAAQWDNRIYLDLARTYIKGDIPPVIAFKLSSPAGFKSLATKEPCLGAIQRIIIGSNEQGQFTCLPAGNTGWSSDWALTYGTDTSSVAKPYASNNECASCDFGTDTSLASRVTMNGTEVVSVIAFHGKYRVFCRASQVGGTAGDIRLALKVQLGGTDAGFPSIEYDAVSMKGKDIGWEVVDLTGTNILNIPFSGFTQDLYDTRLILSLYAERVSGASTLEINDLILIPANSGIIELQDPLLDLDNGGSSLSEESLLEYDQGIVTNKCRKKVWTGWPSPLNQCDAHAWLVDGSQFRVEPGRGAVFHFFMMREADSWGSGIWVADLGMALGVELYHHNRYSVLRGSS